MGHVATILLVAVASIAAAALGARHGIARTRRTDDKIIRDIHLAEEGADVPVLDELQKGGHYLLRTRPGEVTPMYGPYAMGEARPDPAPQCPASGRASGWPGHVGWCRTCDNPTAPILANGKFAPHPARPES